MVSTIAVIVLSSAKLYKSDANSKNMSSMKILNKIRPNLHQVELSCPKLWIQESKRPKDWRIVFICPADVGMSSRGCSAKNRRPWR